MGAYILFTDQVVPDLSLLKLLQGYTRQAIKEHLGYFGNWRIPEAYLHGHCATRLTLEEKCHAMVEVNREDLEQVFADVKETPDILAGFKVDMMVFDSTVSDPRHALRAVVEFKRDSKPEGLASDIKRMSHILEVLPDTTTPSVGIEVLFTIHGKREAALMDRYRFEEAISMLPNGLRCTAPWPEDPEPHSIQIRSGERLYYTAFASQIWQIK